MKRILMSLFVICLGVVSANDLAVNDYREKVDIRSKALKSVDAAEARRHTLSKDIGVKSKIRDLITFKRDARAAAREHFEYDQFAFYAYGDGIAKSYFNLFFCLKF